MTAPIINTKSFEDEEHKERSIKALAKAKKQDEKRAKQGWRNVKINDRVVVFVPCEKDGTPTKQGLAMIKLVKNSL